MAIRMTDALVEAVLRLENNSDFKTLMAAVDEHHKTLQAQLRAAAPDEVLRCLGAETEMYGMVNLVATSRREALRTKKR